MTSIKLVVFIVLVALAGGCATIGTPSGPQRFIMWQRGVILVVTHTCSDKALVFQGGRGQVAEVIGATPVNIPLMPVMMGEREIHVSVHSLDATGKVSAVFVERFWIDQNTTTTQTWLIGGQGWGGASRLSQCPR